MIIIELDNKEHPKARVVFIDFRHEYIDCQWLEADETPSKIYSGDIKIPMKITSLATAEREIKIALTLAALEHT